MANDTSDFITDGFRGIDTHFTEVEIVKRTEHNILARAKRYGRWWMLKGLLPEEADQPVFQEMLRKELELIITLQHPNIVRAFELDRVEGIGLCIVMDWVDGMTLDEYLEKKKPSRHEKKRLMKQLMDAVACIHLHGIVHRDLKPQNIMVTRNGANIQLIDFGLADADNYAILKQPSGTRAYMAPEQAEGGQPDVRNDIFSLGKIVSQMNLGHAADRVARRCTERIDHRYHNIDEMRDALKSSHTARHWKIWAAVVLLVLALTGGYVYYKNIPPKRVFLTDIKQLSNKKQYLIHTRHYKRGSLGMLELHLGTTYNLASQNRCEEATPFAIIQYQGSYYLYSVTDRRFIEVGMHENDAPLACGNCALNIHMEADSCFVIDFKNTKTICSLNVNAVYGVFVTDYGTINSMYDEGNLFMFEEVGDFDPTEALGMMKEPNPEYTAALKNITPGQYVIYTEVENKQGSKKSSAKRYYLRSDGYLTDKPSESAVFTVQKIEENLGKVPAYRIPSWRITYQGKEKQQEKPDTVGFGSPNVEGGKYTASQGHLRVDASKGNLWQDKVLFLGKNGCYAIRSTNIPIEAWGAGLYWTVIDLDKDGTPEADYSPERAYVWKFERKAK